MAHVSVSTARRSGFTLLEVMVALALLTGALLAVAQLLVVAARAAVLSRDVTTATCLAGQKMEQLRGLAWGFDIDGGTSDDADSDVAGWPDAVTGGTGLSRSPPGSLGSNVAGFVDYLDEAGIESTFYDLPSNYPLARGEMPLLKAGPQMLRGYAWAPHAGVKKVDVRVNGGRWDEARIIDAQPNRYTWVRFEFAFSPAPGDYMIETRTTDRTGNAQPATVPDNKGGYNFFALPKFNVRVA